MTDPPPISDSSDRDQETGETAEVPEVGSATAGMRLEQQTLWVDMQIRDAMSRGEFDNLPGAGKPIPGLDGEHDPDWWAKKLIEREQVTGLAPPAIALRAEDADLNARLDRETAETEVRRVLEDFNDRVKHARRQLLGGPPVITPTRDVEAEVDAWRGRRDERRAMQREHVDRMRAQGETKPSRRRRWWSRRDRP